MKRPDSDKKFGVEFYLLQLFIDQMDPVSLPVSYLVELCGLSCFCAHVPRFQ